MRSGKSAFFTLFLVGGSYLVWRNRFAIQRQLESWGIQTPSLKEVKDIKEASRQAVGGF